MPKNFLSKTVARLSRAVSPTPPTPQMTNLSASPPHLPTAPEAVTEAQLLVGHDGTPIVPFPPRPPKKSPPVRRVPISHSSFMELALLSDVLLPVKDDYRDDKPALVDKVLSKSLFTLVPNFPLFSGVHHEFINMVLEPLLTDWTTEIDRTKNGPAVVKECRRQLEMDIADSTKIVEGYEDLVNFTMVTYIPCVNELFSRFNNIHGFTPNWQKTSITQINLSGQTYSLESIIGLFFKGLKRADNIAYAILDFQTKRQIPNKVCDAMMEVFEKGRLYMKETGNTGLDDRVQKDYGPGVMDSIKEALKRTQAWSTTSPLLVQDPYDLAHLRVTPKSSRLRPSGPHSRTRHFW
ncbi:hypothetical protein M231_03495 [Tremella mesenterica]|uniref:Uncharacterized protein n=1 Tax=Tremella mesenterica TaxID=5217 RepID=A0A4Q1BN38_TREME|nr:hypothetical protein M231_03495 [Tremella mesenterica]